MGKLGFFRLLLKSGSNAVLDGFRRIGGSAKAVLYWVSTLPYLPLTLTYQSQSLSVLGLLDTSSSVNVLI
jgi:hypothetical protein